MAPKKRSAQTGYHTYERDRQQKQTARSRAAATFARSGSKCVRAAARIKDGSLRNSASGRGRLFASGYAAGTETDKRRRGKSTAEQKFPTMTTQREQSKRESVRRKTGRQTRPQETVKAAGIGKTETGKYQI